MKKMVCALLIAACSIVFYSPVVLADEAKYELKASATIKDVLQENVGKRVLVRLETGENLEGAVSRVGDNVVHIAKLSGRDFFDAAVRIDKIAAVIFKVRGN